MMVKYDEDKLAKIQARVFRRLGYRVTDDLPTLDMKGQTYVLVKVHLWELLQQGFRETVKEFLKEEESK